MKDEELSDYLMEKYSPATVKIYLFDIRRYISLTVLVGHEGTVVAFAAAEGNMDIKRNIKWHNIIISESTVTSFFKEPNLNPRP